MSPILHFRKQLAGLPVVQVPPGIHVRHLRVPGDVLAWLALRERAMAGQRPSIRSWTPGDFQREIVDKSWWRDERSWVAVADNTCDEIPVLAGAVTLALREGVAETVPVVHWLLVDPAWRRRGIGRLLMSHLERAAWEDGWREVELETHAGWAAAVEFYHSMGYAPVRDRSPR
jgi:GNAT superfamily N-acetyltransferase